MVPLSQREVPLRLRRRLGAAAGAAFLLFGLLLGRLWNLQILHGEEMRTLSESNRIRLHRVQATRGSVIDRYGRVLIDSRPAYDAVLVPEDAVNLENTLENLAQLLAMSSADLHALIKAPGGRAPFQEIVLKRDLGWDEVVTLETHQLDLPGVSLRISPRRSYPRGPILAHVLGYVGEVNAEEMEKDPRYRLGDMVGKAGLEKRWESMLRGVNGGQQVEVDSVGRRLRVLREVEEIPGNTVRLTVDLDLQEAATQALGGRDGSLVALDPNNGEILAYVNAPSFDPNLFARKIRGAEWRALLADKHRPLSNRAIHGQYPPGSTFKIITAAAALEENIVTPFTRIYCPGRAKVGRHTFRCWKHGGHGSVDLHEALVQSCDVYFYQVAQKIGIDAIARYARIFGLGMPTGLDLEHERGGTVPDIAWKRKRFKQPWYVGETVSASIGQGYVTATPMQMANAIAMTALGKRFRPHFVRQVEAADGSVLHREEAEMVQRLEMRATSLKQIRDALYDVVNTSRGTGKKAQLRNVTIAGKTGTSQVVKIGKERLKASQMSWQHRDHAWFVAYAPVVAPEIAIAAVVEHAEGGGGAVAAPVVREVMQSYFQLKQSRDGEKYAQN